MFPDIWSSVSTALCILFAENSGSILFELINETSVAK